MRLGEAGSLRNPLSRKVMRREKSISVPSNSDEQRLCGHAFQNAETSSL